MYRMARAGDDPAAFSVVRELEGDAEVLLLDRPDHGLEVVLRLAAYPKLGALDLGLDLTPAFRTNLESSRPSRPRCLTVELSAGRTLRGRLHRARLEGLERHFPA